MSFVTIVTWRKARRKTLTELKWSLSEGITFWNSSLLLFFRLVILIYFYQYKTQLQTLKVKQEVFKLFISNFSFVHGNLALDVIVIQAMKLCQPDFLRFSVTVNRLNITNRYRKRNLNSSREQFLRLFVSMVNLKSLFNGFIYPVKLVISSWNHR